MIDQEKRSAILLLHKQGHPLRKIAKDVDVSRNSVREVIASGDARVPAIERAQSLDPHLEAVRSLYTECRGNIVRVHEELHLRHAVTVAYTTLTRFCRKNRISQSQPARTVRIITEPGEEMQHDTSPYTIELGGRSVKRHCASLVLGYSRRLYIRFYARFDRFACKCFLTEAFRYMGGSCGRCVIDNSSVVLACGAGLSAQVSPEMEAFEKRFGFRFLAHEINMPDRKGKVERPFDYIENNFLAGRHFRDDVDLNAQALDWLETRANVRRLRELGASPLELFAAEAPHLNPLPLFIPEVYKLHRREVDAYGKIHLEERRYSVPPHVSVDKEVDVRETETEVNIMDGHQELARHPKLTDPAGKKESTLPGHGRRPHRTSLAQIVLPQEDALRALGVQAVGYLDALKRERPGRAYRWSVKVLHRLIGHYPGVEIDRAMGQAGQHRLWDVRRIEGVLLQNLAQDHFQLPLLPPEDFEKSSEFEKGAATPPPDLSAFVDSPEGEVQDPAADADQDPSEGSAE
jgi:transposase